VFHEHRQLDRTSRRHRRIIGMARPSRDLQQQRRQLVSFRLVQAPPNDDEQVNITVDRETGRHR